jgi:hypothetical protein
MSKLDLISGDSIDNHKLLSALGQREYVTKVDNSLDSYIDVKLTAAQLDTLNATPVTLIAAPGANKIINVTKVLGFLDYNSAAYAGSSETLAIRYTNGSGAIICQFSEANFVEATADTYESPEMIAVLPVANAAVVAHATADFTSGNSPIYLRVWYNVVDVSDLGATE